MGSCVDFGDRQARKVVEQVAYGCQCKYSVNLFVEKIRSSTQPAPHRSHNKCKNNLKQTNTHCEWTGAKKNSSKWESRLKRMI